MIIINDKNNKDPPGGPVRPQHRPAPGGREGSHLGRAGLDKNMNMNMNDDNSNDDNNNNDNNSNNEDINIIRI